jgi:hypothetical protein
VAKNDPIATQRSWWNDLASISKVAKRTNISHKFRSGGYKRSNAQEEPFGAELYCAALAAVCLTQPELKAKTLVHRVTDDLARVAVAVIGLHYPIIHRCDHPVSEYLGRGLGQRTVAIGAAHRAAARELDNGLEPQALRAGIADNGKGWVIRVRAASKSDRVGSGWKHDQRYAQLALRPFNAEIVPARLQIVANLFQDRVRREGEEV